MLGRLKTCTTMGGERDLRDHGDSERWHPIYHILRGGMLTSISTSTPGVHHPSFAKDHGLMIHQVLKVTLLSYRINKGAAAQQNAIHSLACKCMYAGLARSKQGAPGFSGNHLTPRSQVSIKKNETHNLAAVSLYLFVTVLLVLQKEKEKYRGLLLFFLGINSDFSHETKDPEPTCIAKR
jgi:hypothetical protein